jgi:LacI family transcriptional regulator
LLREAAAEDGFAPTQVVFPPELIVRASTQG